MLSFTRIKDWPLGSQVCLTMPTEQVEEANEDILDLEKSMTKSEISKAKSLAEKCVMSDYQTWIW